MKKRMFKTVLLGAALFCFLNLDGTNDFYDVKKDVTSEGQNGSSNKILQKISNKQLTVSLQGDKLRITVAAADGLDQGKEINAIEVTQDELMALMGDDGYKLYAEKMRVSEQFIADIKQLLFDLVMMCVVLSLGAFVAREVAYDGGDEAFAKYATNVLSASLGTIIGVIYGCGMGALIAFLEESTDREVSVHVLIGALCGGGLGFGLGCVVREHLYKQSKHFYKQEETRAPLSSPKQEEISTQASKSSGLDTASHQTSSPAKQNELPKESEEFVEDRKDTIDNQKKSSLETVRPRIRLHEYGVRREYKGSR